MNTDPTIEGMLSENFAGIGTVTRSMVDSRARELAVINGRSPHEATNSDWDQAKRELTGEPEMTPEEVIVDSASESERWNPVAGTGGTKAPQISCEGEDQEGRSASERLVQEGVQEAEHDQMLQAAREQQEEDTL